MDLFQQDTGEEGTTLAQPMEFITKKNETCLNLVSIVAVLFRASIVAAEKQYIMKIMNTNFKGIFQPEMKIS